MPRVETWLILSCWSVNPSSLSNHLGIICSLLKHRVLPQKRHLFTFTSLSISSDRRGRNVGYPAPPPQIPAGGFLAPGSSRILASTFQPMLSNLLSPRHLPLPDFRWLVDDSLQGTPASACPLPVPSLLTYMPTCELDPILVRTAVFYLLNPRKCFGNIVSCCVVAKLFQSREFVL